MGLFSREPETAEERWRRLELTHAERMKALQMGRPLPEVEIAQAKADEVRARAAAAWAIVRIIFAAVGPAAVLGIAVGAAAMIFALAAPSLQLALVVLVWVCCALVCLGMIAVTLVGLQKLNLPELLRKQVAARPAPGSSPEGPDSSPDPAALGPEEVEQLARAIQQ